MAGSPSSSLLSKTDLPRELTVSVPNRPPHPLLRSCWSFPDKAETGKGPGQRKTHWFSRKILRSLGKRVLIFPWFLILRETHSRSHEGYRPSGLKNIRGQGRLIVCHLPWIGFNHPTIPFQSSSLTTPNDNVQKTGTGSATAECQLPGGHYTRCDGH